MRPVQAGWLAALALCAAQPAPAQDQAPPSQDVAPGANQEGVVHVNALKNPEVRSYRAVVAGLDAFDDHHALAPKVPQLLFQARDRRDIPLSGTLPTATISADALSLPLALDDAARFAVPRSQAAWDAKAELTLNRHRNEVRVEPLVRTPGLADNQYRLGDIRLECRVKVAIAKEEMPFLFVATINTLLLTTDWCGWFQHGERDGHGMHSPWPVSTGARLASATLFDGNRSANLRVSERSFSVPIGDARWSDDAIVELAFAPADAPRKTARTNGKLRINPEMRSYRSIAAGFDAFDDDHDLAPAAQLRFALRHKDGPPAGADDGLQLRLASADGKVAQAIPVDADGRITLARNQAAYAARADFVLNQPEGQYIAVPEVRTPGLPDNVRRLGDLRLECRVTAAVMEAQLPALARTALDAMAGGSDWCTREDATFGFAAPRKLAGATLQAGGRTRKLQVDGWQYDVPVGDAGWPDDAHIELTYAAP